MTSQEIKELRQKLGLSQEYFAIKVGVSAKTVARWERGTKPIPLAVEKLEQIKRDMEEATHAL